MSTIRQFLAETNHDLHSGIESWRLFALAAGLAFFASVIAQIVV